MPEFAIRGYRPADEAALLAVWNAALPYDTVDARTLRRKVFLDPNFNPDWLLVAEAGGQLAGFCLALIRRVPLEGIGLEPDAGWITAMGVHPTWRGQGAGSALLERALGLFAGAGRRQVLVSTYTPNYFVPGVDVEHYAAGLAFLQKRGFTELYRPLSMDANIVLFNDSHLPEREARLRARGIQVRALELAEIPAFLGFLQANMPGDWVRHARDVLTDIVRGQGDAEQFTVAVRDGEMLGYCQFEGEHLGPFGVRSDVQGQGIGMVLLGSCLLVMRRQGHHNAWVLWTSDDTARRVYSRFGFHETRRFAVLRRQLEP